MKSHWESWSRNELNANWLLVPHDVWHFIKTFVYTTDPHDLENPVKQFPDKPYLELITRAWYENDRFLIPKSRQMLISWLMVACHLWLALFKTGQWVYFQSAKEEKADKLVLRANFIWKMLPGFKPKAQYSYCRLKIPGMNSIIEGVPQGRDAIRQETCSAIFSDEMAFQEEAQLSYIAAKPTVDGPPGRRGRYTGVSSANFPSFFKELVFDES